jgi:hypothetical protein
MMCAQTPSKKELTARELFYAASQTPAKPEPAKPIEAPKPATKADIAKSASKTTNRKTTGKAAVVAQAEPAEQTGGGVKVIRASSQTAPMPANGQPPLGLRVNVMRYNSDGSTTDVLPDTVFHSGDRIRLSIEPNARGFLYIANQGTSGNWRAMFPSPEIENGDNRVEPMHQYVIPSGKQVFTFDTIAGKENLFVVFSRQPVADFEEIIYGLQTGKKPSQPTPERTMTKTLVAQNLGDPAIAKLRTYARDLIVETVDATPPGEKRDTAVYVVNPTGSADSRVVADIVLVHQ